jgi:hypothetical protein
MSDQDDTWGGMFWVRADGGGLVSATPGEACDEIKRLRADNARLRDALTAFLDDAEVQDFGEWLEARLKQACVALAGEVKP